MVVACCRCSLLVCSFVVLMWHVAFNVRDMFIVGHPVQPDQHVVARLPCNVSNCPSIIICVILKPCWLGVYVTSWMRLMAGYQNGLGFRGAEMDVPCWYRHETRNFDEKHNVKLALTLSGIWHSMYRFSFYIVIQHQTHEVCVQPAARISLHI